MLTVTAVVALSTQQTAVEFDVTRFGAVGDGVKLDTMAIDAAYAACECIVCGLGSRHMMWEMLVAELMSPVENFSYVSLASSIDLGVR